MNVTMAMLNIDNKMKVQSPYSSTNEIKFCYKCGGENFYKKIVGYESQYVSEEEIICRDCETIINYWSYGYYENDKCEDYLIIEKRLLRLKKLENIVDGKKLAI